MKYAYKTGEVYTRRNWWEKAHRPRKYGVIFTLQARCNLQWIG